MSKKVLRVVVEVEVDDDINLNEIVAVQHEMFDGLVVYRDSHDTSSYFKIHDIKKIKKELLDSKSSEKKKETACFEKSKTVKC